MTLEQLNKGKEILRTIQMYKDIMRDVQQVIDGKHNIHDLSYQGKRLQLSSTFYVELNSAMQEIAERKYKALEKRIVELEKEFLEL